MGLGMVADVLVPIGDHRSPAVPSTASDDVHLGGQERVGGADDGADVEVVLPVLDGDVEGMSSGVEIVPDRLDRPVPIPVDHVASIAVGQQGEVEAGIVGPRERVRSDADLLIPSWWLTGPFR